MTDDDVEAQLERGYETLIGDTKGERRERWLAQLAGSLVFGVVSVAVELDGHPELIAARADPLPS